MQFVLYVPGSLGCANAALSLRDAIGRDDKGGLGRDDRRRKIMTRCSIHKKVEIVPGCYDDYKQLSHYHYRRSRIGPFTKIFTLKASPSLGGTLYKRPAGVIVYCNPTGELRMRNIATDNFYTGFDRATRLALINRDIRRISRVIIEPRFRGIGLATRLVAETMPQMEVPVIEAVAAMGLINPFFEKAGMKAYPSTPPAASVRLLEALGTIGIEQAELIDPVSVQRKLDKLDAGRAEFIECELRLFLKCDCRNRYLQPGLERTRYVLGKVTTRNVYYIWFNEKFSMAEEY